MPGTIVVADASPLIRQGALDVLAEAGYSVAGAATVEELEAALARSPDVGFVDLHLPPVGCLHVLERADHRSKTRFAVWTCDADDATVLAAIAAGAYAFISKEVTPTELVETARALGRAQATLPPRVATSLVRALHAAARDSRAERSVMLLTTRETEVLRLVADSLRNREIADVLGISEFTVKRHLQNILHKLGLPSRSAAAAFFRAQQPEAPDAARAYG